MIFRALACFWLTCACACAQLQLTDLRTGALCKPTSAIDLGVVDTTGTSVPFRITNTGTSDVVLDTLKIGGFDFDVAQIPALHQPVHPNEAKDFRITLLPSSAGAYSATLYVNKDSYSVIANVTAGAGGSTNPLPPFHIVVDPASLASGQQAKLTIKFDAAASAGGNGLLTLDFNAAGRSGDPAIGFTGPAPKSVPFTIAQGEDTARFQGEPAIYFQTGSTAGTIILTATLGGGIDTQRLDIAKAPVWIDSIRPTTGPGAITLAITGFDNTRSVSELAFTFLDVNGGILGGGPIAAPGAPDQFAQYFANPPLGGQFVVYAAFQVTGDVSQIASVTVGFKNSAGATNASVKMTK
jgi:hypothetical protein